MSRKKSFAEREADLIAILQEAFKAEQDDLAAALEADAQERWRLMEAGPKAELLERMNAWVRGEDPGEPVNWKGLV